VREDPVVDPQRADTRKLVVVTGVPGSGKTTLGCALAGELNAAFLSLDVIKEDLQTADPRLAGRDLRMAAEAMLEERLAQTTRTVVLDIWVQPGRDTDRIAELLRRQGGDVVEVLCRVPSAIAIQRYRSRNRGTPHLPADDETLARIRQSVEALAPLGVGTSVEIDTATPVDLEVLLARLPS
jgi:predicted kinase